MTIYSSAKLIQMSFKMWFYGDEKIGIWCRRIMSHHAHKLYIILHELQAASKLYRNWTEKPNAVLHERIEHKFVKLIKLKIENIKNSLWIFLLEKDLFPKRIYYS